VVVLNADILSALDISALLAAHEAAGRLATLTGFGVADPARYGLLHTEGDKLLGFVEKPQGHPGPGPHFINAGGYVLEPQAVRAIPLGRSVSIERETFPLLIERSGHLGFYELKGLWADIGTFESYFAANFALLAQRYTHGETALWGARDDCAVFKDLIYINQSARLGAGVDLYHRVVVMAGCTLDGANRLQNVLLLPGAHLGEGVRLRDCIVGPGAEVAAGEQLDHALVLREEATAPFYPEAEQPGTA
jgi:mannose-1-phosphate guanylyltransferase